MGRALGKYRIERRVGVGATAEVFEATRPDGSPVVLKRILPQRASDPHFRKLFEAEARIIARLSHPNVVSLLDFGEIDHAYYLALERIDGGDLSGLLAHAGAPGADLSALIARQVAAALAYVHAQSDESGALVHRDVSPANILVAKNGGVKLADFGIAGHGIESTVDGKLPYLAPERKAGAPAGTPSDIFGLGAVLKEMLDGDGPPLLASLVLRAMADDPKDRPDASECIELLDRHLDGCARRPEPSDLEAWIACGLDAALTNPADQLALQLLGESALRSSTAIFAAAPLEPRPLPAARRPIRIPLSILLISIASTAAISATLARTAFTHDPAPEPAPESTPVVPVEPIEITEPTRLTPPPAPEPEVAPIPRSSSHARVRPARVRETGTLTVNSIPWANVYIDGALAGTTPLEATVTAGKHKITLRSGSGKILERFSTEVAPGDHRVHSFDDGIR